MWSADASNYRHVPIGVVQPVDLDDVEATVDIARRYEVPLLPRGASTSIGGQAVNEALIIDFSRHLDRVLEIDPDARTARVQPGVVLDDLRDAARPYGLTFGPEPVDAQPLHARRDDRQQRLRVALRGVGQDRRQRPRARRPAGRRHAHDRRPHPRPRAAARRPGREGAIYRELAQLRDRLGTTIRAELDASRDDAAGQRLQPRAAARRARRRPRPRPRRHRGHLRDDHGRDGRAGRVAAGRGPCACSGSPTPTSPPTTSCRSASTRR